MKTTHYIPHSLIISVRGTFAGEITIETSEGNYLAKDPYIHDGNGIHGIFCKL